LWGLWRCKQRRHELEERPITNNKKGTGVYRRTIELSGAHLAIAEDLGHQTRPDGLAAVHGDDNATPISVAQDVMASFDPNDLEAHAAQGRNHLFAGDG
jgi:hypothetical protein